MGLYLSPTFNFIQTDAKNTTTSSKPGVIYGYAFELSLNENHYIESGFAISYKGGVMNTNNLNTEYKVEYITLPLLIKMRSRQIGYFNYFAKIGPSINFKIQEETNNNARAAGVDISIFLGAEYSLGGKTAIEGSLFFNNNITNSIGNTQQALFHQIGIRVGFLF